VVDRDAVILEALRLRLRESLRDHLADPAPGEALLDRLRVAAVEVASRKPSTVDVTEPPVSVYAWLAFAVS
jgi:hypothetical protein